MNESSVLSVALWTVQAFLAVFFLGAGAPKVLGRGLERWTGFSGLPRPLVVVIGIAEVLGAAGLVLPLALETVLWAGIAAVIAVGRWDLLAARTDVPAWALVAALGLLVPAVVVNLIVILRRPAAPAPGARSHGSPAPVA